MSFKFSTKNREYNLEIRGNCIQVIGESGVGKSLMSRDLVDYIGGAYRVVLVTKNNRGVMSSISSISKNDYIILDVEERDITPEVERYIRKSINDRQNTWIIICRKPLGCVVGSNIAELKRKKLPGNNYSFMLNYGSF